MSHQWDIGETRELVETLYGRQQLNGANPSLRSVIDRQEYARIHYHDMLKVLDEFVQIKLHGTTLIEVIFSSDDETANEFELFILRVQAYATALLQSLHAIPDILGHAIYYCLALDRLANPLSSRNIAANSVLQKLKMDSGLTKLHNLYVDLFRGGNFFHLADAANHSKHRSVVLSSINEDQTGVRPEKYNLQFDAFEYEGKRYPQIPVRDLLASEFDRCSLLVIDIGNELNAVLRSRVP